MNLQKSLLSPSFADGGTYDAYDTDAVREAFRRLIQRGTMMFSGVCVLNASLQYWVGDPLWWLSVVVAIGCLPIYLLAMPRRLFCTFLPSFIGVSLVILGYYSFLGLRYGSDAGFHLKLLATMPVLAMSGRIGIRTKQCLIPLVMVAFVTLDHKIATTAPQMALTPFQIGVLRAINIAQLLVNLAALLMHYFRVVARQQALLSSYAATDQLTGLANRRRLREAWHWVDTTVRSSGQPVSVVLCDIDHFKGINDRLGHEAGDAALCHVGGLLRDNVRDEDTVCRWGGEEFLLLLPNTNLAAAITTAERIRRQLAETALLFRSEQIPLTATLGVAQLRPEDSLEAVVSRADQRLYAGKLAGRNRVMSESLPGIPACGDLQAEPNP